MVHLQSGEAIGVRAERAPAGVRGDRGRPGARGRRWPSATRASALRGRRSAPIESSAAGRVRVRRRPVGVVGQSVVVRRQSVSGRPSVGRRRPSVGPRSPSVGRSRPSVGPRASSVGRVRAAGRCLVRRRTVASRHASVSGRAPAVVRASAGRSVLRRLSSVPSRGLVRLPNAVSRFDLAGVGRSAEAVSHRFGCPSDSRRQWRHKARVVQRIRPAELTTRGGECLGLGRRRFI